MTWTVFVRDTNRDLRGICDDYQELSLVLKFNSVGTWSMALDRRSPQAVNLTTPGWGIIAVRDGTTVMSGTVDTRRHMVSTTDQTITLGGVDDNTTLYWRVVSPAPAEQFPPYTTQEYDVRTGVCSTILRQYTNVNAGPGAVATRVTPGLVLGVDPVVGTSVTGRGRWQRLLTLLQDLAIAGGGLGFRVIQVDDNLEYQVYQPVDRTATVKFSFDLGNLGAFEYTSDSPDATYFYVGGSGEGTARTIYETSDAATMATWGRREGEFIDRRDTSVTAELAQTAATEQERHREQTTLSITPIDTPQLGYLTHYNLGDRITVQIEEGEAGRIQDVVREVSISLTAEHEQVITPKVGTPGDQPIFRLFRQFRDVYRRLNNLERR